MRSQCFHLGEVVVVEEESGPTSSCNAKQGEIQGIKPAKFYQWKYIHSFTVVVIQLSYVWRVGQSDIPIVVSLAAVKQYIYIK